MKIALISQPFDVIVPPSMNSIGIWVYEVSRRLAKDHSVIVYGRRGIASRAPIGHNVNTRYVFSLPNPWLTNLSSQVSRRLSPQKPLFSSPLFYLEYILPIALDLRRQNVDVVHLQNYSQFVPVLRALNPGIKIVLHMRCEWLELLDYEMIDRRLENTDLILGVSQAITDAVRRRFPHHAAKCQVAYTGVDTNFFKPAESSQGDFSRILFVGRITPEKGVHILLEAFRRIVPTFPDLTLDLVGSVSSLARDRLVWMSEDKQIHDLDEFYTGSSYLERLNNILPPDLQQRVNFAGHVHYSETVRYYQRSKILINPALSEPFGRSLIESNACGIPAIATRVGGMAELIEPGKNGLLVEPDQVDCLADSIQQLLKDDALRKQMGRTGRQMVVNRFSWDSIVSSLVTLYLDHFYSARHKSSQFSHRSIR
jgi:glycosyltransferase involved in cell wall biosynthesis